MMQISRIHDSSIVPRPFRAFAPRPAYHLTRCLQTGGALLFPDPGEAAPLAQTATQTTKGGRKMGIMMMTAVRDYPEVGKRIGVRVVKGDRLALEDRDPAPGDVTVEFEGRARVVEGWLRADATESQVGNLRELIKQGVCCK